MKYRTARFRVRKTEVAAAEEAHRQTEHGKQFAAVLDSICEAPPILSELKMISGAGR
jgi:quinol monooxygenase YgiN